MQVDLYLRWLLYLELSAVFIVFIPFLSNVKRSLLMSIAPLLSKIQLIFWIFWSFIGIIFITTIKDVYSANPLNDLDATAKLDLARNERDALMSFISLLLLPIINIHSKSVLNTYKLEQNVSAMTRQAQNASQQYLQLLRETDDNSKSKSKSKQKSKLKTKKNENKDIDMKILKNELEGYKTRLKLASTQRNELKLVVDQLKQQLNQFETLQKVVKKKS